MRQRLLSANGQPVAEAPELPKPGWCLRDSRSVDVRAVATPLFPDDGVISPNQTTSCRNDRPALCRSRNLSSWGGSNEWNWIIVPSRASG